MDSGIEIRLYDPHRRPQDWVELMQPANCAVFLKRRSDSTPLDPDGAAFADPAKATCLLFQCFDAAQRFSEAKVRELPQVCCEIYDSQGLACPPLAIVIHPGFEGEQEEGSLWRRRRKVLIAALVLMAAALFWKATLLSGSRDLVVFLGINCLVLALRFLYWDAGLKHRVRERQQRLDAYRKRVE